MLNLIKYEFIKKYRLISMIVITALALNALALSSGIGGITTFLVLAPIVSYIFYLVDIVKMYSDDLNKKTGYMLFMTPNSGYKIIISKLLTSILEGLALLFFYFIIIIINGAYIAISTGAVIDYSQIIKVVDNFLSGFFGFNLSHIFMFLFAILIVILAFITTVYTAITIRKSILSDVKFGGLFSFIIFLGINWLLSQISTKLFDIITPYLDPLNNIASGRVSPDDLAIIFIPIIVASLVQIIALTGISGYLLEKKINL